MSRYRRGMPHASWNRNVRTPWSRPLLFAFILAVHAVFILLAQRGLIHVPQAPEEPLQIFSVAPPPPIVRPSTPAVVSHPQAQSVPPLAAGPKSDDVLEVTTAPRSPLDIDWSAE